MSVRVMKLVFDAVFYDITFDHKGKPRRVTAPNATLLALAMADNADDEGVGSFSAVSTLAKKTGLSRDTVIATIKALKQESVISYAGVSNYGTNNYSINKNLLVEWSKRPSQQREQPKGLVKKVSDSGQAIGLPSGQAIGLPSVKPSDLSGQAIGHEPSVNHQLTFGASAPAQETSKEHAQKPTPPATWDVAWQLAAGVSEVQLPTEEEQLETRVANALEMFPQEHKELTRAFILATGIFPIKEDVSGWCKAFRDQKNRTGLTPENITQTCVKMFTDGMTIVNPFSVVGTAGGLRSAKSKVPHLAPTPIPANDWRKQIRL